MAVSKAKFFLDAVRAAGAAADEMLRRQMSKDQTALAAVIQPSPYGPMQEIPEERRTALFAGAHRAVGDLLGRLEAGEEIVLPFYSSRPRRNSEKWFAAMHYLTTRFDMPWSEAEAWVARGERPLHRTTFELAKWLELHHGVDGELAAKWWLSE